jgi:hypothetical protein
MLESPDVSDGLRPDEDPRVPAPDAREPMPPALQRAIHARLGSDRGGELLTLASRAEDAAAPDRMLRGRRRRDLVLHGPEYGPADGAAVEISDAFVMAFAPNGFLRASRTHQAGDRDEEDARAFVRFLARQRRIASDAEDASDSERLARERKSHAVVRDPDGVRRLRRIWIAAKGDV